MYSNIPIDRNLKAALQHRPLPCAGPCDDFITFGLRSKVIGGVSLLSLEFKPTTLGPLDGEVSFELLLAGKDLG